ncbi:hypothetical protein GCM10027074_44660 [Streptomyces deserti]
MRGTVRMPGRQLGPRAGGFGPRMSGRRPPSRPDLLRTSRLPGFVRIDAGDSNKQRMQKEDDVS